MCTHTHTMQKQYKIIARNRTCSGRVWQNGGISVEEMHSPRKLAGPLFSMHTGQLEERNFPLSGLSYKGKWHLTLGDQILSTLVVFLQTDFASPIQRK